MGSVAERSADPQVGQLRCLKRFCADQVIVVGGNTAAGSVLVEGATQHVLHPGRIDDGVGSGRSASITQLRASNPAGNPIRFGPSRRQGRGGAASMGRDPVAAPRLAATPCRPVTSGIATAKQTRTTTEAPRQAIKRSRWLTQRWP